MQGGYTIRPVVFINHWHTVQFRESPLIEFRSLVSAKT
jgi:hypothetical protein